MAIPGALAPLFAPRSIAIVGASDDPTRIGGRPIAAVRQGGYAGPIYPVNPTRPQVQGIASYPAVADIPDAIDCAIIAVGAELAVPAIEACAARGVRAAVVFSAGFAEAGPDGIERQRRLKAATAGGMRILGPNCMGLFHTPSRTYATFTALFQGQLPAGGHMGLVSQSGGSGAQILKLAQLRGLPLGTFVTTGNEADVEFGEVLAALAGDDDIRVILAYVEGVRSRDSFLAGLQAARAARKPVILLKVGRTARGAAAAASHTASLAGEDRIYDAVFRQYGVYRARTTEELLDVAYASQAARMVPGRRLGVVTISGGMGAQIADAASDAGLLLPATPADARMRLAALCPPGTPDNPVDITAQLSTDHELMARSLDLLMQTGAFDMVLAFFGLYAGVPVLAERLLDTLREVRARHPGVVACVCIIATPEMQSAYRDAGFLVFEEPARAVAAMAALARLGEGFAEIAPAPHVPGPATIAPGQRFNEMQAKALLAGYGIAAPAEFALGGPDEAHGLVAELAGRVALKVVSGDLAHKSDVGGVALGIAPADLPAAVARMAAELARRAPHARIDGYLVTRMVEDGVEVIVGARRDPLFGPVVLVGLGGLFAELFEDVAVRLAPVDLAQARVMISELRALPLLAGARGAPPADIGALAGIVAAISRFALDNAAALASVEINPVRVLADGRGALALDAAIETQPMPTDR